MAAAADRADLPYPAGLTDRLHPAALAPRRDSDVAQGKVESQGIPGVEGSEPCRHFFGRFPVRGSALPDPDEARDPRDVDVEGDDEIRGVDPLPEAEVDAIGRPRHPAEEQVPALAGAPGRRVGDQVPVTGRVGSPARDAPRVGPVEEPRERCEPGPVLPEALHEALRGSSFEERVLERGVIAEDEPQVLDEEPEVIAAIDPRAEATEEVEVAGRPVSLHVGSRRWAHEPKKALDLGEEGRHLAEGEEGSEHRGDLGIPGVRVGPGKPDGIVLEEPRRCPTRALPERPGDARNPTYPGTIRSGRVPKHYTRPFCSMAERFSFPARRA